MKRILLLFTGVLILVSCSKDNSEDPKPSGPDPEPGLQNPEPPAPEETNALPVTIIVKEGDKTTISTVHYHPDTKKIDKISEEGGRVERYQYDGDLIEKIMFGQENNGDYKVFEYEEGMLTSEILYRNNGLKSKAEYSYPSSSKMEVKNFEYNEDQWEQEGGTIFFTFDAKGNLINAEGDTEDIEGLKIDLTYDSKNAPFINVQGWAQIYFTGGIPLGDNVSYEDVIGRKNNPIKTTVNISGDAAMNMSFAYEFEDDDNKNFPTKITLNKEDEVIITEIIYN